MTLIKWFSKLVVNVVALSIVMVIAVIFVLLTCLSGIANFLF